MEDLSLKNISNKNNVNSALELYEYSIQNNCDDPLKLRYNFICWLEVNCFTPDLKSKFIKLLEETINLFKDDFRYKQDPQFIELIVKYIKLQDDGVELYDALFSQGIGTLLAYFYISWANALNKIDDFRSANHVFKTGIACEAQPIKQLRDAYMQFQVDFGRRMLNDLPSSAEKSQPLMKTKEFCTNDHPQNVEIKSKSYLTIGLKNLKAKKSDSISVPMAMFEPPNPNQIAMYPKQKVYSEGKEFQLEELRAARYYKRYKQSSQKKINSACHEKNVIVSSEMRHLNQNYSKILKETSEDLSVFENSKQMVPFTIYDKSSNNVSKENAYFKNYKENDKFVKNILPVFPDKENSKHVTNYVVDKDKMQNIATIVDDKVGIITSSQYKPLQEFNINTFKTKELKNAVKKVPSIVNNFYKDYSPIKKEDYKENKKPLKEVVETEIDKNNHRNRHLVDIRNDNMKTFTDVITGHRPDAYSVDSYDGDTCHVCTQNNALNNYAFKDVNYKDGGGSDDDNHNELPENINYNNDGDDVAQLADNFFSLNLNKDVVDVTNDNENALFCLNTWENIPTSNSVTLNQNEVIIEENEKFDDKILNVLSDFWNDSDICGAGNSDLRKRYKHSDFIADFVDEKFEDMNYGFKENKSELAIMKQFSDSYEDEVNDGANMNQQRFKNKYVTSKNDVSVVKFDNIIFNKSKKINCFDNYHVNNLKKNNYSNKSKQGQYGDYLKTDGEMIKSNITNETTMEITNCMHKPNRSNTSSKDSSMTASRHLFTMYSSDELSSTSTCSGSQMQSLSNYSSHRNHQASFFNNFNDYISDELCLNNWQEFCNNNNNSVDNYEVLDLSVATSRQRYHQRSCREYYNSDH